MARHYNPTITERLQRAFRFKAGDTLSDDISGPVAVISIKPTARVLASVTGTTSASTNTVLSTASDKDTFIMGVQMHFIKDAACDVATGNVNVQVAIDGVVKQLIRCNTLTLTAQDRNVEVFFPHPIKVDRGVNLTLSQGTFTAGNFVRSATVYGYTEEVNTQNT